MTRPEMGRWDPFAELQQLQSDLSRFLGFGDAPSAIEEGFIPLADVEETDDAYLVELELPGVSKRDIDISIEGRRLTVTGERKDKERVGVLRRRTRAVGRFHYEVLLPGEVDEEGISASLEEGLLTIRVPKRTSERSRHIEVK